MRSIFFVLLLSLFSTAMSWATVRVDPAVNTSTFKLKAIYKIDMTIFIKREIPAEIYQRHEILEATRLDRLNYLESRFREDKFFPVGF